MALSIKDPETEAIAREVAQRKHLSITQAVKVSLEKELADLEREMKRQDADREVRIQEILAWTRENSANWETQEEIDDFLYDEDGLPW